MPTKLTLLLLTMFFSSAALAVDYCQLLVDGADINIEPAEVLGIQEINYKVVGQPAAGESKPTVVLIHGLSSRMETWNPVVNQLAEKYQVVLFDQRGHGETAARGENYTTTLLAKDLKVLLDHLKLNRVSVIGHSMGGRTAIRFAEQYPATVEKVIVEDMHLKGRSKLLPTDFERVRQLSQIPKTFSSKNEIFESYKGLFSEKEAQEMANEAAQDSDGRFRLRWRPEVNLLYSNQGLQENLLPAAKAIPHELLFIAASDRPVLFGVGVDSLKAARPDAKVVVVDDAGHGVHYDQPGAFLGHVFGFLQ